MRNEVLELSFGFSVKIVRFTKIMMKDSRDNYIIANQLLRSGTSIGANIEEANGAQSQKDFTAKMYIAFKEARETNYWLRLIKKTDIVQYNELDQLIKESISLIKLLAKITASLREKNE